MTTGLIKLGILTSHPIQYEAPWFRALAKQVELEAFFAHRPNPSQQGEGFGKSFYWDVELLSGYTYRFLGNTSRRPGLNHFSGCDTPEIRKIIRAGNFDAFIVVGWYLKTFWQAIRACRRAGVPVLVRGDSQRLTPRSPLKRWLKYGAYRFALRQFDGFLCVGQRNREYLAHYGVPDAKMFFAPHFVDNEVFRQKGEIFRKQKAEIRKRWRIPDDAFCVLFCGKFIPKKRPLDLVEAAKLLEQRGDLSNIHLLFVGSGELGAQLRESCNVVFDAENPISQSPVASRRPPAASFAGFQNQSELPAAYVAADVLVLPSDGGETWGLVVNEAMACALPAIVSDAVGCGPDLIEYGKTGFSFPLGDDASLAERLATLANMKSAGHDFAPALAAKMKAYSIESSVVGTLTALKSIQSRRKMQ